MAGKRAIPLVLGIFFLAFSTGCVKLGETTDLARAPEPTVPPSDRINCEEILGTAFNSETERAWFMENCSKWPLVKVADEQVAPPGAAQARNEPPECAAIRGKPYESNEQRAWYLQNCNGQRNQSNQAEAQPPAPPAPPAPNAQDQATSGGNRADCNAIRGTTYRSSAERAWFQQNCGGNSANTSAPTSAPAASTGPDRASCNAIRGTEYRSDAERAWFVANCT